MRYLVSEPSAAILRQLAAERGGVAFDDRVVDRQGPARPRPFACRVDRQAGAQHDETHMLCFLPPLCSEAIRWEGAALAPVQISLGTVAEPWVDLGAWTEAKRVWLVISPPDPSGGTSAWQGGWTVKLEPNPPSDISGHSAYPHLVAALETSLAGDKRFVQYHLGSMLLAGGDGDDCPDVYSVEKKTGTLPSCVAARYEFKRQHRHLDPTTGQCIDDTGTGSSETTNIDVPAPDAYALSCVETTGAGGGEVRRISLEKTPCGEAATTVGSCDIPLLNAVLLKNITSLAVSGNNLVLTYEWVSVSNGIVSASGTDSVSCPITVCS